jgi:hypothetical protein
MSEQLYKKEGRKYIPIGYSDGFTGFPADGLWIVYTRPGCKSETCIAQVGKIKSIDYSLMASLIVNKEDECLKALEVLMKNPYSRSNIVETIFETILKK